MIPLDQLQSKILDAIEASAHAHAYLEKAGIEYAQAEHAYRQARSSSYLRHSTERQDDGKKLTEPHLAAMVDRDTDTQMLRVRLAEANKEAAMQNMLRLRNETNALQSVLKSQSEEAKALAYGQTVGA